MLKGGGEEEEVRSYLVHLTHRVQDNSRSSKPNASVSHSQTHVCLHSVRGGDTAICRIHEDGKEGNALATKSFHGH